MADLGLDNVEVAGQGLEDVVELELGLDDAVCSELGGVLGRGSQRCIGRTRVSWVLNGCAVYLGWRPVLPELGTLAHRVGEQAGPWMVQGYSNLAWAGPG